MDSVKKGSSLQFVAMKLHSGDSSVEEVLAWMADRGQSVLLNWGEDNDAWECSWISGGVRFTGVQRDMRTAILQSLNKCFSACVEKDYGIESPERP